MHKAWVRKDSVLLGTRLICMVVSKNPYSSHRRDFPLLSVLTGIISNRQTGTEGADEVPVLHGS